MGVSNDHHDEPARIIIRPEELWAIETQTAPFGAAGTGIKPSTGESSARETQSDSSSDGTSPHATSGEQKLIDQVPENVADSVCSICLSPLYAADGQIECSDCGQPYHSECWQENLGCATYGCSKVGALRSGPDIKIDYSTTAISSSTEPTGAAPPYGSSTSDHARVSIQERDGWLRTETGWAQGAEEAKALIQERDRLLSRRRLYSGLSILTGVLGFASLVSAAALGEKSTAVPALTALSIALFVPAAGLLAMYRGHNPLWGLLSFILPFISLLLVWLLPDLNRKRIREIESRRMMIGFPPTTLDATPIGKTSSGDYPRAIVEGTNRLIRGDVSVPKLSPARAARWSKYWQTFLTRWFCWMVAVTAMLVIGHQMDKAKRSESFGREIEPRVVSDYDMDNNADTDAELGRKIATVVAIGAILAFLPYPVENRWPFSRQTKVADRKTR